MENIFEILVTKLLEVGFYDFLLFVIALGLFYAILKKTKFFDSPVVTGVLAFSIAFLIFGYPVLMNFSLVLPFTAFFTQSFLFILVFFIGMLIASFFYPDLPKFIGEHFTSRTMMFVGITIGVAVALISGSTTLIWLTPAQEDPRPSAPSEVTSIASGVIIFMILLIIAGSIALRGAS